MGRKRKRKGGGLTLERVLEVATTSVGLAALVYETIQAQRHARRDHDAAAPPPDRPGPADRGNAVPDTGSPAPAAHALKVGAWHGMPSGIGAVGMMAEAAHALLDLNSAPAEALMRLKKIGRKKARRIIAHRPYARGKDFIPSPAEFTSSGLGIGGDGRRAAPAA